MKRFNFKTVGMLSAILALLAIALPVSAQDMTPAVNVSDQVSLDGNVVIDSVTSNGPGFIVIHRDNGDGSPGQVIGHTAVFDGQSSSTISVAIDSQAATPMLFAMLHTDDNTAGEYEFGTVDGADAPVTVDDSVVMQSFNFVALNAADQFLSDNQVAIAAVTAQQPGWVVIHADQDGQPGEVVGHVAVDAGTSTNLTVDLMGESTNVLWPMLHVDTGAEGEYEFGSVEGADNPVSVNNRVAVLPIWTVPHVRAANQPLGAMNQLSFSRVLIDQPGWLVIHADQDGQPGEVLGHSAQLSAGLNRGVTVEVDPSAANTTVWAMLHYDTGTVGEYEFGTVEGTDGPVTVDNSPVISSLQVGAVESQDMMGEESGGEMMQETAVDVSLFEWGIEMPASVPAGTVIFNVTNNGSFDHNLEVEGNGIEQVFDTNLAPGESGSMTVELEPGTYDVYCPVGDHAGQGMQLELTVEG